MTIPSFFNGQVLQGPELTLALQAVSDDAQAAVASDLAAPSGAALVGVGVGRTQADKNAETVSITDHGAVSGSDCADAIIDAAASTTGTILIPAGAWAASATTGKSSAILAALHRVRCDGALSINLAAGEHSFSSQVVVNSPDAQRIQIIGAPVVSTTATSQVSVSGPAKAYAVVLGVASSAGASVGDYALIRTDVSGTGDYYAHAGVWKITAVDPGGANRLALVNTHHGAAFPTNTLTGGSIKILKTILKFTGCDGFRFEGGQPLGLLDQVAIVGDYDLAAGTGTVGAHGLIGVSPVIVGGASSNSVFNTEAQVILGVNVGFSAWGEQGIAISGRGSLVGNFVASCSNRKRGFYADGASFRTKYAIANGNGEDGFIADSTGYLQCAYAIGSGNGLNGFWSTNNSMVAGGNAKASGNLGAGFEARGASRLAADDGVSIDNGSAGFLSGDGGMIDADSATATGNAGGGFDASSGSIIDCDNSTSANNTGYGYRARYGAVVRAGGAAVSGNTLGAYYSRDGSVLVESGAAINPNDVALPTVGAKVWNPQKTAYFETVLTSAGDMVLKSGSTSRLVLRASGVLYPAADNTQSLGQSPERWSVLYAGTGTINTSDEREKQQIRALSDAEHAVAVTCKGLIRAFKFSDAVTLKGEGARVHFGVIAQDVKAAFEAEGLDPFAYALLCYDEWEASPELLDENKAIVTPAGTAGNRYGVRYDELLAFIIAGM